MTVLLLLLLGKNFTWSWPWPYSDTRLSGPWSDLWPVWHHSSFSSTSLVCCERPLNRPPTSPSLSLFSIDLASRCVGPHQWMQRATLYDRYWKPLDTSAHTATVLLKMQLPKNNAIWGAFNYVLKSAVKSNASGGALKAPQPAFFVLVGPQRLSSVTDSVKGASRWTFTLYETKGRSHVLVKCHLWRLVDSTWVVAWSYWATEEKGNKINVTAEEKWDHKSI